MMLSIVIVRMGLGIVFLISGLLILKSDDKWTHMLPEWIAKYQNLSRLLMISTGWGDLALGLWLVSGYFTGTAAVLAAIHLVTVLIASGRKEFHSVYRDIGLLFAALALAVHFLQ